MFQTLHRMMANGGTLQVACEACPHASSLDRDVAFRLLGPDASPAEVRAKLRCSGCGQGSPRVWITRR